MEVRCTLCGKVDTITKVHKDYIKLARQTKNTYVCELCHNRLRYQAVEHGKPKKPI